MQNIFFGVDVKCEKELDALSLKNARKKGLYAKKGCLCKMYIYPLSSSERTKTKKVLFFS